MSERVKAGYEKFGDEQLQRHKGLVVKRLHLVVPEKAAKLRVVGAEGASGPVFISDHVEDGKGPGNPVENYRQYVYRVGEVLNSQNPNNHYGGGLFIDRLSRQGDYSWIAPSNGEGKWIGWAEPRRVRNGGSVAESLRLVKAQPICWNYGVDEHFKEISSGFVYESADGYLLPVCDLDQHPIEIQPRKLLGKIDNHLIWIDQRKAWDKDVRYRFSVAENGQVEFSPVKAK